MLFLLHALRQVLREPHDRSLRLFPAFLLVTEVDHPVLDPVLLVEVHQDLLRDGQVELLLDEFAAVGNREATPRLQALVTQQMLFYSAVDLASPLPASLEARVVPLVELVVVGLVPLECVVEGGGQYAQFVCNLPVPHHDFGALWISAVAQEHCILQLLLCHLAILV